MALVIKGTVATSDNRISKDQCVAMQKEVSEKVDFLRWDLTMLPMLS